jgi:hypothetical protein
MTTHLVVPDPHASPDHDNVRFDLLGAMIMDRRPEVILCVGDFGCMPSLSSYDKGRRSFEGARYKRDVDAVINAQQRMFGPLIEHNNRCRRFKIRQYSPRTILLGGNHDEGRIERVTQDHPELHEFVSLANLRYYNFWSEYIPYKKPVVVDGVSYCHHFPTGVSGRPISGKNIARQLLNKLHCSVTVGHIHTFDVADDSTGDGRYIMGLAAGCFIDFDPPYATDTVKDWWRGVVVKHNVQDGIYDLERVSLDRMRKLYA